MMALINRGENAMLSWLQKLRNSNPETKQFVFMVCIFTAGVIVPVAYCFMRLDYVRSYDIPEKVLESQDIKD